MKGWLTPRYGRFIAGKETLFLLNSKLGDPQSQSEYFWAKEFLCRITSYVIHAYWRGEKTRLHRVEYFCRS